MTMHTNLIITALNLIVLFTFQENYNSEDALRKYLHDHDCEQ